jgi:hypothetical protein
VLQSAEKRDPSQRKIHQRSKVARRQITGFQGEGIFVRLAQTLNVDQPARRRKSQPGSHCRLILNDFGGPAFKRQMSARGLALGDFSNDGAVDVLISCNNEPPSLLRNNAGNRNHWLGVKLVGTKSNIDAIGARVTWQAGDLKRTVMKVGGGSYLSYHDPRLVLGIGPPQQNRANRDPLAAAQRIGPAVDRSSPRSLHHDSRTTGKVGVTLLSVFPRLSMAQFAERENARRARVAQAGTLGSAKRTYLLAGEMSTTCRVLVFGSIVAVTFTLWPSNCFALSWSSS